ncbi:MAG TPA: sirohydrochlorin cobaltochelatase [Clostridium sp.]
MTNYDTAILVVSFGTSYNNTRERTIDAIEKDIQTTFENHKIFKAFTSTMIIKKLKERDNIYIDTVSEALENIIENNIKNLIIQPTHIINGIENDIMLETCKKYSSHFDSIKIGSPLLTSTKDYEDITASLMKEFSSLKKDEALICMGHGTDHHANSTYAALDYMFKDKGYPNVFIGTVEAYPTLNTVKRSLKSLQPRKVILTPLMVVSGDHATNDMASDEEDSWKTFFEKEGYIVECHLKGLGEYPSIRDMYIDHITNATKFK